MASLTVSDVKTFTPASTAASAAAPASPSVASAGRLISYSRKASNAVSFRSGSLNDIQECSGSDGDGDVDEDDRSTDGTRTSTAARTNTVAKSPRRQQPAALMADLRSHDSAGETGQGGSVLLDKKGPASVASSHRTTTSAGFNTALTSIRKLALADWGEMEPSTRLLGSCIRATFIAVFVMAIVGYAVMLQSSSSLESATKHIIKAGYLRDAMVHVKYNTRTLQQLAVGTLTGIEDEAVSRAELQRSADTMHDLHQELYLGTGDLPGSLKAFYADNSLWLATTDGRTVTDRVTNIWNGINMVIAAANVLAVTPMNEITDTSPNVFLIAQNTDSLDHLFQNMVTFMHLYEGDAVDVAQRGIVIQACIMAVAIGVLVLIVCIVFPLVMRHVNSSANQVLTAYLDLTSAQIVQLEQSRQELLVTLGVSTEDGGIVAVVKLRAIDRP